MKHNKLAILVGIFTISMVTLLILGFIDIAREKGLFEKKIYVYLKTDRADLFTAGMPVYFNGVEVALLKEMILNEDGLVRLKIEIKEKNHKWIRDDAEFFLDKPLVGSSVVRVSSTLSRPLIKADVQKEITIKDGINDVINRLEPVLQITENIATNVAILIASLLDKNEPTQQILANVEMLTAKLGSQPLMNSLTGDENMTKQISSTINTLDGTLYKLQDTLDTTNATISNANNMIITKSGESIQKVNEILDDVKAKLKKLDTTVDMVADISPEITSLKNDVKSTIDKTDRLIDKFGAYFDDYNKKEVALP